jgi:hypothetical protein
LKGIIRKSPELAIPANTPITLYQPDGSTEINPMASIESLGAINDGKPLIVRIEEVAEESSIVASVLRSNMTIGEKESTLKEFLQSKDRELQSKERELQALEEKTKGIQAQRDFLKGTLDARHIFENYELGFPRPNPKTKMPTRAERWKKHLALNTNIRKKLEECDKEISWQNKAVEIYEDLCRNIHHQTIDTGEGKYIVMIEKSLPKTSSCFIKVLANELYGDNVVVQQYTLGPEMEAS